MLFNPLLLIKVVLVAYLVVNLWVSISAWSSRCVRRSLSGPTALLEALLAAAVLMVIP